MPHLSNCPFCGAGAHKAPRFGNEGTEWKCGSFKSGVQTWQSQDCKLDSAQARLDALEQLAAEQCGHSPESTTDPLEAIRRELARLRADADCWTCEDCGASRLDLDPATGEAAVKAATSPGDEFRQPQTPDTGIGAIIGKWPGDETDEEIDLLCGD